jgi:hypothetical protein
MQGVSNRDEILVDDTSVYVTVSSGQASVKVAK